MKILVENNEKSESWSIYFLPGADEPGCLPSVCRIPSGGLTFGEFHKFLSTVVDEMKKPAKMHPEGFPEGLIKPVEITQEGLKDGQSLGASIYGARATIKINQIILDHYPTLPELEELLASYEQTEESL